MVINKFLKASNKISWILEWKGFKFIIPKDICKGWKSEKSESLKIKNPHNIIQEKIKKHLKRHLFTLFKRDLSDNHNSSLSLSHTHTKW